MRIKQEVWAVIALVAMLLAYLIDKLSGPILISIGNPIAFLSSPIFLRKFPFTATAIFVRTFGIFISVMLVTSMFKGKYFTKAITLFFVGLLGEFYSIQQLATGFRITTIQWTLSIAYASVSLLIGIIWLIFMGIWASFNKSGNSVPTNEKLNEEKSVLNPPADSV